MGGGGLSLVGIHLSMPLGGAEIRGTAAAASSPWKKQSKSNRSLLAFMLAAGTALTMIRVPGTGS